MKTIDVKKNTQALPTIQTGKRGRPAVDWIEFGKSIKPGDKVVIVTSSAPAALTTAKKIKAAIKGKVKVKAIDTTNNKVIITR